MAHGLATPRGTAPTGSGRPSSSDARLKPKSGHPHASGQAISLLDLALPDPPALAVRSTARSRINPSIHLQMEPSHPTSDVRSFPTRTVQHRGDEMNVQVNA